MNLAIISHTEHYKLSDGSLVGWGPTVTEINQLAKGFDKIYHIAFLHPDVPPPSALPYTSSKVIFIPLKPIGGKGLGAKLKIIWNSPHIISTVKQTLRKVDVFQFRAPTGMGVFLIPYLSVFSRKKGWYKYAGNWNQKNPPLGYALQRWMLKKQHRKVTINGRWPHQPVQCLSFENPCLTEDERGQGLQYIRGKNYRPPFVFCFVGRLEDAKGVARIINAVGKLESCEKIETLHFVGDGPKLEVYMDQCKKLGVPAQFHGFLDRQKVFDIYKKSHFFLLPSTASEGFPKAIAEAMNFGCIPIVSSVSSIGQYITHTQGFLVEPCTEEVLLARLQTVLESGKKELEKKAVTGHHSVSNFTFENYINRIKKEVISSLNL